MTAWRYRRCPSCRRVFPGGELRPVSYGAHWGARGTAKRRCPCCGFIAPTHYFGIVREKHGRGREMEGATDA